MLLCCTFLLTCFCDTLTIADDMQRGECSHRHTEECYTQLIQCVFDANAGTDTDVGTDIDTSAGGDTGTDSDTDEKNDIGTDSEADIDSERSNTESEERSQHICSEESGCITKILQCPHVHDEYCGYYGTPKELSVRSWEWVDDEELLVLDEHNGTWGLGLPGASRENPLTAELLTELLPQKIRATLSDGSEKSIPIEWELSDFPGDGLYEGQHTVSAALAKGYTLDESAPKVEVLLDLGGASTMAVDTKKLEPYIVSDRVIDPDNTVVNLFNYGVTGGVSPGANAHDRLTTSADCYHPRNVEFISNPAGWQKATQFVNPQNWNQGINKNHLITFGNALIVHAGLWNRGGGASSPYGQMFAGMEGIVNSVLGADGFPSINAGSANKLLDGDTTKYTLVNAAGQTKQYNKWELVGDWRLAGEHCNTPDAQNYGFNNIPADTVKNLSDTIIKNWETSTGKKFGTGDGEETESLAYLFDPTVGNNNQFKKSYTDVKGLFQLDNDGYYYYDMRKNFAEFAEGKNGDANRFILYDAPATKNSIDKKVGNFLPFDKGTEVFSGITNGELVSDVACDANGIDHYFGLTVQTEFRQPIGGRVSNDKNESKDMTFEFSGDDDVWVFVDDVLVLDLGGVHSEIFGTINFATGDVYIGRSFSKDGKQTLGLPDLSTPESREKHKDQIVNHYKLKDLFEAAGRLDSTQWTGDTFASHTDHKIKLFYLERGNYDSSLTLRFNLVPRLFQQIKKVDQDGSPLAGVGFDLYAAEEVTDADGSTSYRATGDILTSLVTDADGIAQFREGTEAPSPGAIDERPPFNFSDRYAQQGQKYYILRETRTPSGYRKLPTDIILEFDSTTSMLTVKNRYQSGSYASFISTVIGNHNITYGTFDETTGDINSTDGSPVLSDDQRDGLVIAIPMLYEKTSEKWKALYGSNVTGLSSVTPESRTPQAWREACLTAMLYQCSDQNANVPKWYLAWNDETKRLEGTLSDLPGMASRYLLNNPDGDMKMAYAIIQKEALAALGIDHGSLNDDEVYAAIGAKINSLVSEGKTLEAAIAGVRDIILNGNGDNRRFYSLNTDQFNRSFRSLIYIPNERRELRVWKVDQTGQPVNGVEFSIYANADCSGTPLATGRTANVGGRDGVLIFTPSPEMTGDSVSPGYSRMMWSDHENARYYLKETHAPDNFKLNETVVPINVGVYSIYADAGDSDDGITVMTEVGKLAQTMKKYAADEEVNITLRDITATAQTQQSGKFSPDGWQNMMLEGTDTVRSLNLHYGQNEIIDYGIHTEDGGDKLYPYFVTDSGFITVRVKQNEAAIKGTSSYGDSRNDANYDLLGDMDITSLFSLVNIVVVTDTDTTKTDYGSLTVSKRIEGPAELIKNDYGRTFEFKIELTDRDGNPVDRNDQFYFYGKDKSGYIRNGDTFFLHHDETFTILGLPVGTHYTVTETPDSTNQYLAAGGTQRSGVIEAPSADTATQSEQRADFVNVRNSVIFEFTKTDAFDGSHVLPGAEFSLYRWIGEGEADNSTPIDTSTAPDAAKWTLVASAESGADGLVRFEEYLTVGTYRLVETRAPVGYLRPKSQWQFRVTVTDVSMEIDMDSFIYVGDRGDKPPAFLTEVTTENGVAVRKYKLPNMPAEDLPFTGGGQRSQFMLLGAGLFCTASFLAIFYSAYGGRRRSGVKKC